MATVLETVGSVNTTKAEIDKCLNRCLNAPYPNAERKLKLDKLRDEAKSVSDRATAELNRIDGPAREPLEKLQKEMAQLQREQQEQVQARNNAQSVFGAKQQEYNARARQAGASGRAAEKTELDAQWQTTSQDFEIAHAKFNTLIAELQTRINENQAQQQKDQQRLNEEVTRLRNGAASDAMLGAEQEMQSLLDRAGAMEKEIASGANVELAQKVTAELDNKIEIFSKAETHHESQARKLFWAMIGVIVLAASAVYILFIYLTAAADSIERIVALTTGRIAILVFLGFALKYLAGLHRAHSEQAIIYCDRQAALSVAKVLLNATPELEQKRTILKTLADIYLKFEDSAFVTRRSKAQDSNADIDAQIKRMKDVFEGMKPVLDAIGKVADKIKP